MDVAMLTDGSVYQEYLAKSLTDKYGNLNVQMDKLVNDANTELDSLNQKLAGTSTQSLRASNAN